MSKAYAIILLKDAIKYAFQEVRQLYYMIDEESKEEYVICGYRLNGDSFYNPGEFKICVTADSIPAMYDDVWKAVKKRFG
jgi:hypothetical protein